MLAHKDPEAAKQMLQLAEQDVWTRWKLYEYLATMPVNGNKKEEA